MQIVDTKAMATIATGTATRKIIILGWKMNLVPTTECCELTFRNQKNFVLTVECDGAGWCDDDRCNMQHPNLEENCGVWHLMMGFLT